MADLLKAYHLNYLEYLEDLMDQLCDFESEQTVHQDTRSRIAERLEPQSQRHLDALVLNSSRLSGKLVSAREQAYALWKLARDEYVVKYGHYKVGPSETLGDDE